MATITQTWKTRQAAARLGTNPAALRAAIERGKVEVPPKDVSGDFVWTAEGIEAARAALAVDRRRKRPQD
jgi:hypothetical protein